MKCKKINKENNGVFMVDSQGNTVELTDNNQLCKYENNNRVQLLNMLNDFFESEDSKNHQVLADIVRLAREKNIDHYAYGEVSDHSDTCLIDYSMNNRQALIDCRIRIFYKEQEDLSFMIMFGRGTTGSIPGFEYYLTFDHKNYTNDIRPLIEKYFSLINDAKQEIELLNYFRTKVEDRIYYYYS